jgi:hypothetical protein
MVATNHLNPVEPAGIYVERQDGGGYSFEMVSNGASVAVRHASTANCSLAFDACMREMMLHYGKLAIACDVLNAGQDYCSTLNIGETIMGTGAEAISTPGNGATPPAGTPPAGTPPAGATRIRHTASDVVRHRPHWKRRRCSRPRS